VERELAIDPAELAPEIAPVEELLRAIGPVAVALERALVVALERDLVEAKLERDQAAVELERVPVEPELDPLRAQLAVVPTTKSVTAAHRRDLVPPLAAEDLAVAVAVTTREPAATEAVIAWEAADIAVVEAVVAAAVAVVAEAEAVAAAGGDEKSR
jgi:hypothetical protein